MSPLGHSTSPSETKGVSGDLEGISVLFQTDEREFTSFNEKHFYCVYRSPLIPRLSRIFEFRQWARENDLHNGRVVSGCLKYGQTSSSILVQQQWVRGREANCVLIFIFDSKIFISFPPGGEISLFCLLELLSLSPNLWEHSRWENVFPILS